MARNERRYPKRTAAQRFFGGASLVHWHWIKFESLRAFQPLRIDHDLDDLLKSFMVRPDALGIHSFTDMLAKINYQDTCEGNFEKRVFGCTKGHCFFVPVAVEVSVLMFVLLSVYTSLSEVEMNTRCAFLKHWRLIWIKIHNTDPSVQGLLYQPWPRVARKSGWRANTATWQAQSAWPSTLFLQQVNWQLPWDLHRLEWMVSQTVQSVFWPATLCMASASDRWWQFACTRLLWVEKPKISSECKVQIQGCIKYMTCVVITRIHRDFTISPYLVSTRRLALRLAWTKPPC